jgi:UDP-glucose 4-epimerase
MKNILVTGSNGYLGSNLIKGLIESSYPEKKEIGQIVAVDIRPCPEERKQPHVKYYVDDIRSEKMSEYMKENNIDVVIHLASLMSPTKKEDRELEYNVDVLGTRNILDACLKNKVKRILISSSGAAYGYHPDNPAWLKESDAIRGNYEFPYSYHKRIVEEDLAKYRKDHPELEQIIFRIGTIIGKNVKNQITDLFEKPVILGIQGSKSPFVFIWDQDVVNCFMKAIFSEKTGIFNLAGDGAVTIDEQAELLKKPKVLLPAQVLSLSLAILKKINMTQYGPEKINFLRYRPVLDNAKLKSDFGYKPQYTSKEAFIKFIVEKESP